MRAFVAFTGKTDIRWLRILRPGFRHCFVILCDEDHWILLDPMSSHLEISLHSVSEEFDLLGGLAGQGYLIVPAYIDRTRCKPAPAMIFSCVEAVKRVIGMHDRFVITPWQLYRRLIYVNTLKGESSWEV